LRAVAISGEDDTAKREVGGGDQGRRGAVTFGQEDSEPGSGTGEADLVSNGY
jgi:hypothetical protein